MRMQLCAATLAFAASMPVATHSAWAVNLGHVYAIDVFANPNRLIRFPVDDPAHTVISYSAGYNGFAMDFNADCTVLWGITESPNRFGRVNTSNGNFTPVGTVTGVLPETTNFDGMAVDTNDVIYVLGSTGALGNATLYTINPATAVVTPIGSLGVSHAMFAGLAIDRDGQMYAHDIWTDALFRVDKTTGQATLIGPTGFAANYAQGMDFDWETNTLYAALYASQGVGIFAQLDTQTGAALSLMSTTPWNAEMEIAIASPAPEPAAAALLALAVVPVLCRRQPCRPPRR